MSIARFLIAVTLVLVSSAYGAEISFNHHVRPILADNCFNCHGADSAARKAGLRLDTREGAIKGGKSGEPSIVPGKPVQSGLLKRITTHDEDDVMPPLKTGRKLTPEQISLLKSWISAGAKYEAHWAFVPPVRPKVPGGRRQTNSIDAFVRSRLAQQNLSPSPRAESTTLLRRVALDITGLPPSPEQMAEFTKSRSSATYGKLVDQLLASPRYGENIAVRWLDWARYADTSGFQGDPRRTMWRWRDYVIDSFNSNKPFDRFTIEQIAGDLLPDANLETRLATGFHRNHRFNSEFGAIEEEWKVENVVDRVETVSATWLGLTMGCARCHDHKFDPISQRDFYSFFAFFNNVPERGCLLGCFR